MALTKVVTRAVPLNCTTEPLVKFVPVTVRTKSRPPAGLLEGEMVLIETGGVATVRLTAFEVPPPGAALNTVIG